MEGRKIFRPYADHCDRAFSPLPSPQTSQTNSHPAVTVVIPPDEPEPLLDTIGNGPENLGDIPPHGEIPERGHGGQKTPRPAVGWAK